MPKLPFFTADFYQLDDPGAETSQLQNLYPEILESGTGKAPGRLVGTPGLLLFANVGSGPVRALWMGEGRLFCVSGHRIYEVFGDGTSSDYGEVGWSNPQTPAQIFVNGDEMLVISAGYAYRVHRNDADTAYITEHIKLIAAEYTDLALGVKAFYYDLAIDGSNQTRYTNLAIGVAVFYSDLSITNPAATSYTDLMIGAKAFYSDLAIDAVNNTKVSSVARPFISGDIGLEIIIRSGTGWSSGGYFVTAVTGGVATLDFPAGTVGATGGTAQLLDGTNTTVKSATTSFSGGDVGATLEFPDPNAPGVTPGTYTITSVTGGIATLDSSPGTPGFPGVMATIHPIPKLTSTARPFVSGDVGKTLVIQSGTDFTPGSYTITAVAGGNATLSDTPGTAGATGGTGQILDGTNTTVSSPSARFDSSVDVGGTLVFHDPNAPGFTAGTYTIDSVDGSGIATLHTSPGTAGSTGGVATKYPAGTSTAPKVSSAARSFVDGDVGLDLMIISGTDFTPGTYTITAVTGGVAELNTSPGTGTTGAKDGVGYLLDGLLNTVISATPTLAFTKDDIGGTLVIDPHSPAGFTPGSYHIGDVTDYGAAVLSDVAGTVAGTTGGIATEYPGEGPATDADGNLKAITGAYLDGYGIIAPPPQKKILSNKFYINDPSAGGFYRWVAIDYGLKEGYPDNILALFADHEELYIFGDLQSTEVWRDTGAANFPFERDMSAFMHYGIAAQYTVTQLGTNGVAWLAWSANRGAPEAWYAAGFQPQRISTHALENQWRTYPNVRDAVAYSYLEDGHHFYVISFPSADVTWCYDLTASQQIGKPVWHARTYFDGTNFHRHRGWVHTYGYFLVDDAHAGPDWTHGLTHYVGDWENGYIYAMGLYYYTDNGNQLKRQLIFPHLSNDNKRTVWHLFQLDCQVGTGVADVEWTLDMSRDKGHTFIVPRTRTATAGGPKNQRLRWWRCGESWDQVWRLETSSPAPISITNAYFEATPAAS